VNVGEVVGEAVNEPHGAITSQSAGCSNSGAAAANSGAAADAEEAVHRRGFRKDVKEWIFKECVAYFGSRDVLDKLAPPNSTLKKILESGIANGKLPAGTVLEQVRHVARTWRPVVAAPSKDVKVIDQKCTGERSTGRTSTEWWAVSSLWQRTLNRPKPQSASCKKHVEHKYRSTSVTCKTAARRDCFAECEFFK
jgi:hypothetical protein